MAQPTEDDPLVIGSHFNYRFVSSLLNKSRGPSQWLAFGGCSQYLLRIRFSGTESFSRSFTMARPGLQEQTQQGSVLGHTVPDLDGFDFNRRHLWHRKQVVFSVLLIA